MRQIKANGAKGPKLNAIQPAVTTIKGAAAYLAVSPRSVQNYIRLGALKAVKIGGAVRIPRHQLEEIVGA